jgi:hypothetical protein
MKNTFILLISIFSTWACSTSSISTLTPAQAKIASLTLKSNQSVGVFWIGESTPVTLSVDLKDDKGIIIANYAGKISYFANEKELTTNEFNTDIEGVYILKVQVENLTNSITYTVKSPQKELDKIAIVSSGFVNKYAVNQTMIDTKPELTVKGFDKIGVEVPIQKGLKTMIGTSEYNINSLTFDKAGTQKIIVSAYGKEADIIFEVRSPRTFEVIRIPLIFHFCLPTRYNPNATESDAAMQKKSLEQLKDDNYIKILNQVFRNQYEKDIASYDPNAQDSFIEFYLAETDPDGKPLQQKGVNLLNFTKPYQTGSNYDYSTPDVKEYLQNRENIVKKWNPNMYLNFFVEPFANNYGYSGAAADGGLDIDRKQFISSDFFKLPIVGSNIGYGTFYAKGLNTFIYLNGSTHFFSPNSNSSIERVIPHEIGHILGLPHTFGASSNCADKIHSDGLFDTPTSAYSTSIRDCSGVQFIQRNIMSYLFVENKQYFTYDQVTVMRATIEAGFNLPTPRNKGKSSGRISSENLERKGEVINCKSFNNVQ